LRKVAGGSPFILLLTFCDRLPGWLLLKHTVKAIGIIARSGIDKVERTAARRVRADLP